MPAYFIIRLLATLVVAVFATPAPSRSIHVLHEQRSYIPQGWSQHSRLPGHALIPVRIGLQQQNLHRQEEYINDVSHPDSPNYGRHWTSNQVLDAFAPSFETINAVRSWLHDFGVDPSAIKISSSRGWLTFNATTRQLEEMLNAKYHVYTHASGHKHIACDSYSVPVHVAKHIDIITPTIHFDQKIGYSHREHRPFPVPSVSTENPLAMRRAIPRHNPALVGLNSKHSTLKKRQDQVGKSHGIMGSESDPWKPKEGALVNNALMNLDSCDSMITPPCLRALYDMPPGSKANKNNNLGVVEYTPQAYLQSDLDNWFRQFAPELVGQTPQTNLIDGAVVQQTNKSFALNAESSLDLQYAMALVAPQKVTLYQVGDVVTGASFNNFLDALDESYCTFQGGDSKDPEVDGQYPDPAKDGYKGPKACGTVKTTNVLSTSYGSNEADLSSRYVQRQCAEYMKLGLQGVSVLYASGDFGVAGTTGGCINPVTQAYNNGSSGIFVPSFPGGCPYVTSVGATQVNPGSTVRVREAAAARVIQSGGGFSNVFAMPSYQKTAMANYFNNFAPSYGSDRFNNSQRVRGFPDVSANGVNYVINVLGNFSLIYGTSASCPTFASVLSNINEERLAVGKSPVGFVNPVLYQHPEVLNDVVTGGNKGCGTAGFSAVEGWDPVTGLGTPNFPAMLELFMSLP